MHKNAEQVTLPTKDLPFRLFLSYIREALPAAADRFFQRLEENEEHQADSEGQDEHHQKEILLGHFLPERPQISRKIVAEKTGEEPHAHHHGDDASGSDFGYEGESYRGKIDFADSERERAGCQPPKARLGVDR